MDWPAVREIIHGSCRIVHELMRGPDTVCILRFRHAARGTPEIFGDRPGLCGFPRRHGS
jgi:hypothetical protein